MGVIGRLLLICECECHFIAKRPSHDLDFLFTGRDKGAYWHELFLRSKCFLADRMERVKLAGPVPKGRKRNAPETEPNFYLMKPLPPLGSDAGRNSAAPTATPSLPSVSSTTSSGDTNSLFALAPRMTALEVLQQQCLQNTLGSQGLNGLLGLPQANLNEAQLSQLVRPLLLQQAEQQQQQVQDLETQLLLQEQIKIMRARLVAQILARSS